MANYDDDSDLFKKAMAGVRPLKDVNKIPTPQQKVKRVKKISSEFTETSLHLSDHCNEDIAHEQFLSYQKIGMQPKYFRQLKQGKIAVEAELDLHGHTINEAREAFSRFLLVSQYENFRCVRIIHGKGYRAESKTPLMKTKVYTWLKQTPNILAFCSCTPRDGGTGAVYVLFTRG